MAFLPNIKKNNNFFTIHTQSIPSHKWVLGPSNKSINVIVFVESDHNVIETVDFVLEEKGNTWIISFSDLVYPEGITGYVHVFETGERTIVINDNKTVWTSVTLNGTVDLLSTLPFNIIKLTFDSGEVLTFYKRNSSFGETFEEYAATPFNMISGALLLNGTHNDFVSSSLSISEGKIHKLVSISGAMTENEVFETTTNDMLFFGLTKTINDISIIDRYNVIPFLVGSSMKRISDDVFVSSAIKTLSIPLFLVYN